MEKKRFVSSANATVMLTAFVLNLTFAHFVNLEFFSSGERHSFVEAVNQVFPGVTRQSHTVERIHVISQTLETFGSIFDWKPMKNSHV